MKCKSVACIWSGSPPVQQVTSTALLHHPPTLYTGGSDGSIISWNLNFNPQQEMIKPVAMLCGHAAPISDLAICIPDEDLSSNSTNRRLLISACTDGVLCLWSRASGHCRRRRKIPPWAGTPFMIKTLPDNMRYVCVTCYVSQGCPLKCSVIIVDSYSLTIVQTVYHGNVEMGCLKSMGVHVDDMEKRLVMIVDSVGKVVRLPIVKDVDANGKGQSVLVPEEVGWVEDAEGKGVFVAFAKCRDVLAHVYRTYCTFRQARDGTVLGKIVFTDDDQFCFEDRLHVMGGMFLGDDGGDEGNSDTGFVEEFVAWNNLGRAFIYRISYSRDDFVYELLCKIPAVLEPSDTGMSFSFIPFNRYLLRVESVGCHVNEHVFCEPQVTIWVLPEQNDNYGGTHLECEMTGEGNLFDSWAVDSSSSTIQCPIQDASSAEIHVIDEKTRGDRVVSSSMVISENHLAPYAIAYGLFNGDIEIVKFDTLFASLDPLIQHQADSHGGANKQYLLGHRGRVLCLASHQMASKSEKYTSSHVLLSGSMDCTIRVWDLESGDLITVLHQHVAPVRQIILAPRQSEYPWSDCFLTVGDDYCASLCSLHTLRVERLFPGHMYFPEKVAWDGVRGYVACLCLHQSEKTDALDILYIWDVKTGARERILRGAAAHSMFDHFLVVLSESVSLGSSININTSVSSLVFPVMEGSKVAQNSKVVFQSDKQPIKSSCPFPGVSTLCFDLTSLLSLCSNNELSADESLIEPNNDVKGVVEETETDMLSPHHTNGKSDSVSTGSSVIAPEGSVRTIEGSLLLFSLSFLHLWNVDSELDNLLVTEMKLRRPNSFIVSSGMMGDRGGITLTFPGSASTLELWRSSAEYSALRSLTMVSLAQHLISLSHSCSSASSALAAFYTRKFAEKVTVVKPPLLQLLVSFWQNEFDHVKMAARSLFHCAASRAIPSPLACSKAHEHVSVHMSPYEDQEDFTEEESEITSWIESYQMQGWITCVAGTTQDAMCSQIMVAAALAVWYPSLVKHNLPVIIVHPLMKLVMSVNEKYSAAAAEILAEGMESTWGTCIGSEIPRLIGDLFFQVECVGGKSAAKNSTPSHNVWESLVRILLPSLAMADIPGFLHVIEHQIWSTASDSPVHAVALMTLTRVVRGSPKNLAPYLDKVVTFILQTMDPSNLTMRKTCIQSSMKAMEEVVRVFPMVSLNDTSTRLAVGDAIAQVNTAIIRVYDMQSMSKIKILDASGPLGLPSFLGGSSEVGIVTAISALSFSPDGEGLVAFSENGLMIRWWSLGSVWWEKISRNLVPVQCTKLIFVPPWEGFSPTSTRTSIMASFLRDEGLANSPRNNKALAEMDRLKVLIHNLDLSYRLEWVGTRKVKLTQYSQELGIFQL